MKVLLISANTTHTPHPVYPLGLDYVRGALTPRHEVRILDVNVAGALEQLEGLLRDDCPDVTGISIRNIDNVDALDARSYISGYERIVRVVRECTRAPLVLGGSGFSIFPGELMSLLDADFGVVGEGEAMAQLVDALEKGSDPALLHGIVTRGGPVGSPAPWTGAIARQLGPKDDRLGFYIDRGGILNLQTKRGCPYRCIYCTYPHIEGRRQRLFPPDDVAREARELQELGARYLFITDSTFNTDYDHSLAVAKAFRRRGVTIPWGAFLAPTRPPDGYYDTLTEAGLSHAEFGTETLCDPQLKRYGKPFGVKEVFAAHQSARRAGAHVAHYLLLGGPGEAPRTLEETMRHAEELDKAVLFAFCGIRIFPHTHLYEIALEEGQIRPDQDLLSPIFYRPRGIALEEVAATVRKRARGRINWVCGGGGDQTQKVVSRMHARGHCGPLWELLLR